jgi:hyperosmotically inducible protein
MNLISMKLFGILSFAFAYFMLSNDSVASEPTTSQLTDARQETQIWTTYALSPYLRATDLKVTVTNGVALLRGIVNDETDKELANEIAVGVKGIKTVDNRILVKSDYVRPNNTKNERSFGEYTDDISITSAIKSKLLWNRHTENLKIHVETKLGNVTLTGNSDTASNKELAGSLALNTRGVNHVDNKLVVNNKQKISKRAEQKISDSWITTKVKSTYLYSMRCKRSRVVVLSPLTLVG